VTDRIGLEVDVGAIVGLLPRERVEPQRLLVSLEMELSLEACGTSGDLAGGVDYAEMDARIRFLAVHGRFLLIESLAVAILRAVLDAPRSGETRARVRRATVTIRKPDVLRASVPSVTLCRDAAWATGDLLVDVPEATARFSTTPAGAAHPVGDGWLVVEARP
jgi:dihydroneopterin aldolase